MNRSPETFVHGRSDSGDDLPAKPGEEQHRQGCGTQPQDQRRGEKPLRFRFRISLRLHPLVGGVTCRSPRRSVTMQVISPIAQGRRGITVLALLLIIIAVIVAAIFLLRYLRQPA